METIQKGNCSMETKSLFLSLILSEYTEMNFELVGLLITGNAEWHGLVNLSFSIVILEAG